MARRRLTDEEFDRQYAAAVEASRIERLTKPHAVAARYDAATGLIEIELQNGCRFAFPAEYAQGLRGATHEQLAAVEVDPDGYSLHWEELDADLTVWPLLEGRFGGDRWMEQWDGSGWAAHPGGARVDEPAAAEPPAPRRRAS
ncbi:MAG TPA: DUF2442 domain-containing protein [Longimicrobiaceae bacterium]|nr:DUF2442 domain-containing protein [Longimicrobiaceae bacterium]